MNKNKIIKKNTLLMILFFIFMLVGCIEKDTSGTTSNTSTNKTATKDSVKKDTIIVAQGADAKTLDPHATNDQPSSMVSCQIYDTLVEQGNDLEIKPVLAESWEQPDSVTTIFHLRKNVKFHNGEELKASDVKFTLDRMKNSEQVSYIVDFIDSVDIVDDNTVKIKTKSPFGALFAHLSHTAAGIINEKAVKESGNKYGHEPIGTGPYKLKEWKTGDRIFLEANDDYFRGKPAIKNVVFRNIPENTGRAIALETGEIDICLGIDPIDKKRIKESDKLTFLEEPSFSMAYFGFNVKKPPLDNAKVRQAIACAIDQDAIVDTIWQGSAVKANSIIGPNIFGYSKDAKMWPRDIQMSKKLLTEAGFKDGFKLKITTNDNQMRRDMAVILQDQLKEVGIDLQVETVEWGTFLDSTGRGEHEMYILGWVTVTGDADYGIYALIHSSAQGPAGNRSFYSNSDIDQWLDKARTSNNQEERKELYSNIQKKIQEDLPIYAIAYTNNNAGIQNNVQGFKLRAAGHYKIYGTSFKE